MSSSSTSLSSSGEPEMIPLSFHQERLWFIDQFETGEVYRHSPVYHNLPLVMRIEGRLDERLSAKSLDRIIARHETLRTQIVTRDGQGWQVVRPSGCIKLENLACDRLDSDPLVVAMAFAKQPFSISESPPIRAGLIPGPDQTSILVVVLHHILADRESLRLLAAEFAEVYRAGVERREPRLPELPCQFGEFSQWQRSIGDRELEPVLFHWRRQLGGHLAPVQLPSFRARPSVHVFKEGTISFAESIDLSRSLRQSFQTLELSVLAAYVLLLHFYSRQDEVIAGITDPGRHHAGTESVIGPLANLLTLRHCWKGIKTFSEAVSSIAGLLDEARKNRDMPFDRLVQRLNPGKDMSRTALFDCLFSYNENVRSRFDLAGTKVECIETNFGYGKYDLHLYVNAHDGGISGYITYNAELYEECQVQRMAGHYRSLLRTLACEPERCLHDYCLLNAEERSTQIDTWSTAHTSPPDLDVVHRVFEEQAMRMPDRIAVIDGERKLSYRILDGAANRLARFLRGEGVKTETMVALCLPRSAEMIVAILATLKAGAVYLPLDPDFPADRVGFIARDSCAEFLITFKSLQHHFPASAMRVICLDEIGPILARTSSRRAAVDVLPDNAAYCLYTSGSTGHPKGVLVRHGNVARLLLNKGPKFNFQQAHVWSLFHSYCFDFSVWEMYGALFFGGTVLIVPRKVTTDPSEFLRLLQREGVSILNQTPSAFYALAREAARRRPLRWGLKYVIFGGEALNPARLQAWREIDQDATLVNMFGITETTVHVTAHIVGSGDLNTEASVIGGPIPGAQVYVLGDHGELLPEGVAGELFVGGDGMSRGYLRRPGLTAERFVPHPFLPGQRLYRSGDVVRWRTDGALVYLGRCDHQVQVRGFRIEPGEIEQALRRAPGVRDAVVVSRDDGSGDLRLAAYVVNEPKEALTAVQLRNHLKTKLPDYMIPSTITLLERLPVNANGKVDRRSLPRPEEVSAAQPGRIEARTTMERLVIQSWEQALNRKGIGADENFFDLGGHSLLLVQVRDDLSRQIGREIPVVDLFRFPTVQTLAAHLSPAGGAEQRGPVVQRSVTTPAGDGIAVIGMIGRFPGADDVDQYWENIKRGVESISFFSEQELLEAGIDGELIRHPRYVRARGTLEGIDLFDAPFFGYAPLEAALIDPQQRLFLQHSWRLLEVAGYGAADARPRIGVYAGSSMNSYILQFLTRKEAFDAPGLFQTLISNDKDFLATRVSYKLNLLGPAVNVQSACSTSLVAVHMACQAIRAGECEMALAGGVSVGVPQKNGYLYQEEGIASPDGHCRAFDASAKGTVGGSGLGIVLLKPLAAALADGDEIHGVIKGTAINNDGGSKVGYTAPSVSGQARVIRDALARAGVSPDTVGYVEAHGTGTVLGDPIEVAALTEAFRSGTDRNQYCALGSVKPNIGHLDAAAGIAGLIKAILALKHQVVPPSINFERPNPKINLEQSPFYISPRLAPWPEGAFPRRAGISSFGIGGTNAHVIIEEAPMGVPSGPRPESPFHLLVWSAKSFSALDRLTTELASSFRRRPDLNLADVAYTLQAGRAAFPFRRYQVCGTLAEACDKLPLISKTPSAEPVLKRLPLVFLFPGQGTQFAGMGRELYAAEPKFRDEVDRCLEILQPLLGDEFRSTLFEKSDAAAEKLSGTAWAQPALFVIEYAMARLWMTWGLQPQALLGHSIGEYVAAALAEVFTLEDALQLVVERAMLMEGVSRGAMLAIAMSEEKALAFIDESGAASSVGVAAVNEDDAVVVSGPCEAIQLIQDGLRDRGTAFRALRVFRAFHSSMMIPVAESLRAKLRKVRFHSPKIPIISNLTGDWIPPQDGYSSDYWSEHLLRPVRFSAGVKTVLRDLSPGFLEVGPGHSLTSICRRLAGRDVPAFSSMNGAGSNESEVRKLLCALGGLWSAGAEVHWPAFHEGRRGRRVSLPGHPFDPKRHWLDSGERTASGKDFRSDGRTKRPLDRWFYVPGWKPAPWEEPGRFSCGSSRDEWLLFTGGAATDHRLTEVLQREKQNVITVRPGLRFSEDSGGTYSLNPNCRSDYDLLVERLRERARRPRFIIHAWALCSGPSISEQQEPSGLDPLTAGFYSLLYLAQALGNGLPGHPLTLQVLATGVHNVTGEEIIRPLHATTLGPCQVIPQEYPHIRCLMLDIGNRTAATEDEFLADRLLRRIKAAETPAMAALRGQRLWTPSLEAVSLPSAAAGLIRFRKEGVYLITGGLGGIGGTLAEWLIRTIGAKVALVGRTPLPPKAAWDEYLETHPESDPTGLKLRRLLELESLGGEVVAVSADVADLVQMRSVVEAVESRLGSICGVIHAAGVPGGGIVQLKTREMAEAVMVAKIRGTQNLAEVFNNRPLDFFACCSSLNAYGGEGQVDYCAANAFLDAFASSSAPSFRTVSINWDAWQKVGMAASTPLPPALSARREERLAGAILPEEGQEVFQRVLASGLPRVVVSTHDLAPAIAKMDQRWDRAPMVAADRNAMREEDQERPELDTAYEAPAGVVEAKIAEIWQSLLGVRRVGRHDDFFALGGHSLIAIQVISRLQEAFGVELSLAALLDHATVEALGAVIDKARESDQARCLAGVEEGEI